MASRQTNGPEPKRTRRAPATTPEARENQMIAAAYDLAEQQILSGQASSQVISHFLKLGTERERLERRKIELEGDLLVARAESIASAARVEELYKDAIVAMRAYGGQSQPEMPDEYDD